MQPMMIYAFNHPSKKAAIYGELDEAGLVIFAVNAAKDSPIRGTELFRRMMAAFGDDVRAILGSWTKGRGESMNIDEVNRLTASGMILEDAVLKAWTVTRAKKLGFDKVKVVYSEGVPGAYIRIQVLIEK